MSQSPDPSHNPTKPETPAEPGSGRGPHELPALQGDEAPVRGGGAFWLVICLALVCIGGALLILTR